MYEKPSVERFGTFRDLTQDMLEPGTGDSILGCAAPDGGPGPGPRS